MIKINLLRDSGAPGAMTVHSADTSAAAPFSLSNEDSRDLIVKVGMMILPPVLMFMYKGYSSVVMKSELATIQEQYDTAQKKLKSLDPAVKETEKFLEEKHKLASQLDVIKQLSKERLKNVKSLDALQQLIPEKSWLTKLKIFENKVELAGFATDDIVISDFMQSLEASIYFANVTLGSSSQSKKPEGVLKEFVIKCNLENL